MTELLQAKEEVVIIDDYSSVSSGFNEQYEELQKNLVFNPAVALWYECEMCHRKSATPERLARHVEQKHTRKSEDNTTNLSDETAVVSGINKDSEPFKCLSCPFACTTNADLMRHSKKHKGVKPYSCKICGKSFSQKGNLKPHMLRHTGNSPYQCQICTRSFNHKTSLKKHMDDHENPKTIPCRYCKKYTFATIEERTAHEKAKHTKEDVDCIVCGVILNSALGLKMHIAQMHADYPGASLLCADKKWACQYCNKKFSTKAYLLTHHNIHRGEKNFKCELCQYTAVSRDSVKKHTERAHGQMRPLSCNLCDKTFTYYSHKKAHMLRHYNLKPFNCHRCPRSFLLKRHLSDHIRMHDGVYNFKCDKCDVAYILPDSLRKHKDLHLSNPIKCHMCHMEFWVTGRYNKHMLKHRRDFNGKPASTSASKKPFKCHMCSKAFKLSRFLNKHIMNGCSDTTRSKLECSECCMRIPTESLLKVHMKTFHNLKEYSCFVCAEPFKRIQHLVEHMEDNHPTDVDKNLRSMHIAIQRKKVMKHEKSLRKSAATVRDDIILFTVDEPEPVSNVLIIDERAMMQDAQLETNSIKEETSEITYECYSCGIVCNSYDELVEHQMMHEYELESPIKREEATDLNSTSSISLDGGSPVLHNVDFEMTDNLITRVTEDDSQSDESTEELECEINIGETSGLDTELIREAKNEMTADDSDAENCLTCYECSICKSQYTSYDDCEQHVNLVHSNR